MARACLLVAALTACTPGARSDPPLTVDAALDFGEVATNLVVTKTVKVSNPNAYGVVIDSFDNTGDSAFIGQFIPHRLLPGETLEIAVYFLAGTTALLEEHETTFRLAWGDDGVAEVKVTGTTVFVDCTPRSVELGNVLLGDTATGSLVVLNESPLESAATVGGLHVESNDQFAFDGGGTYPLFPGQGLELPVTFHADREGAAEARIDVTAHELCTPAEVRVHAQGVTELVSCFPSTVQFGRGMVGERLATVLQLANLGFPSATITIPSGDFAFLDGGHAFALPGARLIEGGDGPFVEATFEFVPITFTASQSGPRSAQLTSSARGPFSCTLEGIGAP